MTHIGPLDVLPIACTLTHRLSERLAAGRYSWLALLKLASGAATRG